MGDFAKRGEEYYRSIFGDDYFERNGGPRKIAKPKRKPKKRRIRGLLADHVKEAIRMTRQKLNMKENEKIGPDEMATFLKYFALGRLINDYVTEHGEDNFAVEDGEYVVIAALREACASDGKIAAKLQQDINGYIEHTASQIREGFLRFAEGDIDPAIDSPAMHERLTRASYIETIKNITIGELESVQFAPEVKIPAKRSKLSEVNSCLEGDVNHTVIFDAKVNIQNELYPLMIDASIHDRLKYGKHITNVIGVHHSWLTDDGKAKRIIYYDSRTGELIETDLDRPMSIKTVQYHSMDKDAHRDLSEKFADKWVEINLYDQASMVADSKIHTLETLKAGSFEEDENLPNFERVTHTLSIYDVIALVESFAERVSGGKQNVQIVVKPDDKTESEGVEVFNVNRNRIGEQSRIVKYIMKLKENRTDVLLEDLRGNLFYAEHPDAPKRRFDLRVNVSWNGEAYDVGLDDMSALGLSGYAVVAPDEETLIASVSRGGSIMDARHVLDNLYIRKGSGWIKVELSAQNFKEILKDTARAFEEYNEKLGEDDDLMLAGIDVKLEADSMFTDSDSDHYYAQPVIKEINPRPAGLAHSKPFTDEIASSFNHWGYTAQLSARTSTVAMAAIEKNVLEKSFDHASGVIKAKFQGEGHATIEREGQAITLDRKRLDNTKRAISAVEKLLMSKHKASKIPDELYVPAMQVCNILIREIEDLQVRAIPRDFIINFETYLAGMGIHGDFTQERWTLLQEDAFDIDPESPIDLLKLGIALFHEKLEALAVAEDRGFKMSELVEIVLSKVFWDSGKMNEQKIKEILNSFGEDVRNALQPLGRQDEWYETHQLARRGFQAKVFGVSNDHVAPFIRAIVRAGVAKNMIDEFTKTDLAQPGDGQAPSLNEDNLATKLEEILTEHALVTEKRTAEVIPYLYKKVHDMPLAHVRCAQILNRFKEDVPHIIAKLVTDWVHAGPRGESVAACQVSHEQILGLLNLISPDDITRVYKRIQEGLKELIDGDTLNNDPYIHLKKQRAYWILRDLTLLMEPEASEERKKAIRGEFGEKISTEAKKDDKKNYRAMMAKLPTIPENLKINLKDDEVSVAWCAMRLTHSSGNASDHAQDNQVMPSVADPMAIRLAIGEHDDEVYPVYVAQEKTKDNVLELYSYDRLATDMYKVDELWLSPDDSLKVRKFVVTRQDLKDLASGDTRKIHDLFCLGYEDKERANRKAFTKDNVFTDRDNPFAFLIYSLINEGIVKFDGNEDDYLANPIKFLDDIASFTDGKGLKISVANIGMSGAGFASGSAVSNAITLSGFNMAGLSEHAEMPKPLCYLSLMLECALMRGTGYQDTFGDLGGYKPLSTRPRKGIPDVTMEQEFFSDAQAQHIKEHQAVFYTGRQAHAAGALYGKHDAFLSHNPDMFGVGIMESFDVHREMVSAFEEERWDDLGFWQDRYVQLREKITPGGATNHITEHMFRELKARGVIHGGELVGAMRGGGMAIASLTDAGMETMETTDGRTITKFQFELERLREWTDPLYIALRELGALGKDIDEQTLRAALSELRSLVNRSVIDDIVFDDDAIFDRKEYKELRTALEKIKHSVHDTEKLSNEEFHSPLRANRVVRVAYDEKGLHGGIEKKNDHVSGMPRYLVEVLWFKRLREAFLDPTINDPRDVISGDDIRIIADIAPTDMMTVKAATASLPLYIGDTKGNLEAVKKLELAVRYAYETGKVELMLVENGEKITVTKAGATPQAATTARTSSTMASSFDDTIKDDRFRITQQTAQQTGRTATADGREPKAEPPASQDLGSLQAALRKLTTLDEDGLINISKEELDEILPVLERHLEGLNAGIRRDDIDRVISGIRQDTRRNIKDTAYVKFLKCELADIVDDSDNVTDITDIGFAHIFGLKHRSVNAFVVTPDGKIILQRRAPGQRKYQMYLSVFGGHLKSGQSYEEGIREELEQELELSESVKGKLVSLGKEDYTVEGINNKEKRELFAYFLTVDEYAKLQKTNSELNYMKRRYTRDQFERWIRTGQAKQAGYKEVWGYYEVEIADILEADTEEVFVEDDNAKEVLHYLNVDDQFKDEAVTEKAFFTPDMLERIAKNNTLIDSLRAALIGPHAGGRTATADTFFGEMHTAISEALGLFGEMMKDPDEVKLEFARLEVDTGDEEDIDSFYRHLLSISFLIEQGVWHQAYDLVRKIDERIKVRMDTSLRDRNKTFSEFTIRIQLLHNKMAAFLARLYGAGIDYSIFPPAFPVEGAGPDQHARTATASDATPATQLVDGQNVTLPAGVQYKGEISHVIVVADYSKTLSPGLIGLEGEYHDAFEAALGNIDDMIVCSGNSLDKMRGGFISTLVSKMQAAKKALLAKISLLYDTSDGALGLTDEGKEKSHWTPEPCSHDERERLTEGQIEVFWDIMADKAKTLGIDRQRALLKKEELLQRFRSDRETEEWKTASPDKTYYLHLTDDEFDWMGDIYIYDTGGMLCLEFDNASENFTEKMGGELTPLMRAIADPVRDSYLRSDDSIKYITPGPTFVDLTKATKNSGTLRYLGRKEVRKKYAGKGKVAVFLLGDSENDDHLNLTTEDFAKLGIDAVVIPAFVGKDKQSAAKFTNNAITTVPKLADGGALMLRAASQVRGRNLSEVIVPAATARTATADGREPKSAMGIEGEGGASGQAAMFLVNRKRNMDFTKVFTHPEDAIMVMQFIRSAFVAPENEREAAAAVEMMVTHGAVQEEAEIHIEDIVGLGRMAAKLAEGGRTSTVLETAVGLPTVIPADRVVYKEEDPVRVGPEEWVKDDARFEVKAGYAAPVTVRPGVIRGEDVRVDRGDSVRIPVPAVPQYSPPAKKGARRRPPAAKGKTDVLSQVVEKASRPEPLSVIGISRQDAITSIVFTPDGVDASPKTIKGYGNYDLGRNLAEKLKGKGIRVLVTPASISFFYYNGRRFITSVPCNMARSSEGDIKGIINGMLKTAERRAGFVEGAVFVQRTGDGFEIVLPDGNEIKAEDRSGFAAAWNELKYRGVNAEYSAKRGVHRVQFAFGEHKSIAFDPVVENLETIADHINFAIRVTERPKTTVVAARTATTVPGRMFAKKATVVTDQLRQLRAQLKDDLTPTQKLSIRAKIRALETHGTHIDVDNLFTIAENGILTDEQAERFRRTIEEYFVKAEADFRSEPDSSPLNFIYDGSNELITIGNGLEWDLVINHARREYVASRRAAAEKYKAIAEPDMMIDHTPLGESCDICNVKERDVIAYLSFQDNDYMLMCNCNPHGPHSMLLLRVDPAPQRITENFITLFSGCIKALGDGYLGFYNEHFASASLYHDHGQICMMDPIPAIFRNLHAGRLNIDRIANIDFNQVHRTGAKPDYVTVSHATNWPGATFCYDAENPAALGYASSRIFEGMQQRNIANNVNIISHDGKLEMVHFVTQAGNDRAAGLIPEYEKAYGRFSGGERGGWLIILDNAARDHMSAWHAKDPDGFGAHVRAKFNEASLPSDEAVSIAEVLLDNYRVHGRTATAIGPVRAVTRRDGKLHIALQGGGGTLALSEGVIAAELSDEFRKRHIPVIARLTDDLAKGDPTEIMLYYHQNDGGVTYISSFWIAQATDEIQSTINRAVERAAELHKEDTTEARVPEPARTSTARPVSFAEPVAKRRLKRDSYHYESDEVRVYFNLVDPQATRAQQSGVRYELTIAVRYGLGMFRPQFDINAATIDELCRALNHDVFDKGAVMDFGALRGAGGFKNIAFSRKFQDRPEGVDFVTSTASVEEPLRFATVLGRMLEPTHARMACRDIAELAVERNITLKREDEIVTWLNANFGNSSIPLVAAVPKRDRKEQADLDERVDSGDTKVRRVVQIRGTDDKRESIMREEGVLCTLVLPVKEDPIDKIANSLMGALDERAKMLKPAKTGRTATASSGTAKYKIETVTRTSEGTIIVEYSYPGRQDKITAETNEELVSKLYTKMLKGRSIRIVFAKPDGISLCYYNGKKFVTTEAFEMNGSPSRIFEILTTVLKSAKPRDSFDEGVLEVERMRETGALSITLPDGGVIVSRAWSDFVRQWNQLAPKEIEAAKSPLGTNVVELYIHAGDANLPLAEFTPAIDSTGLISAYINDAFCKVEEMSGSAARTGRTATTGVTEGRKSLKELKREAGKVKLTFEGPAVTDNAEYSATTALGLIAALESAFRGTGIRIIYSHDIQSGHETLRINYYNGEEFVISKALDLFHEFSQDAIRERINTALAEAVPLEHFDERALTVRRNRNEVTVTLPNGNEIISQDGPAFSSGWTDIFGAGDAGVICTWDPASGIVDFHASKDSSAEGRLESFRYRVATPFGIAWKITKALNAMEKPTDSPAIGRTATVRGIIEGPDEFFVTSQFENTFVKIEAGGETIAETRDNTELAIALDTWLADSALNAQPMEGFSTRVNLYTELEAGGPIELGHFFMNDAASAIVVRIVNAAQRAGEIARATERLEERRHKGRPATTLDIDDLQFNQTPGGDVITIRLKAGDDLLFIAPAAETAREIVDRINDGKLADHGFSATWVSNIKIELHYHGRTEPVGVRPISRQGLKTAMSELMKDDTRTPARTAITDDMKPTVFWMPFSAQHFEDGISVDTGGTRYFDAEGQSFDITEIESTEGLTRKVSIAAMSAKGGQDTGDWTLQTVYLAEGESQVTPNGEFSIKILKLEAENVTIELTRLPAGSSEEKPDTSRTSTVSGRVVFKKPIKLGTEQAFDAEAKQAYVVTVSGLKWFEAIGRPVDDPVDTKGLTPKVTVGALKRNTMGATETTIYMSGRLMEEGESGETLDGAYRIRVVRISPESHKAEIEVTEITASEKPAGLKPTKAIDIEQDMQGIFARAFRNIGIALTASNLYNSVKDTLKQAVPSEKASQDLYEGIETIFGDIRTTFAGNDPQMAQHDFAKRVVEPLEAAEFAAAKLMDRTVPTEGAVIAHYIPTQFYEYNSKLWNDTMDSINARADREAYRLNHSNINLDLLNTNSAEELALDLMERLNAADNSRNTILYLPLSIINILASDRTNGRVTELLRTATLVSYDYGENAEERLIVPEGLFAWGEAVRNIGNENEVDSMRYAMMRSLYSALTGRNISREHVELLLSDPYEFLMHALEFRPITPELQRWLIDYQELRFQTIEAELAA